MLLSYQSFVRPGQLVFEMTKIASNHNMSATTQLCLFNKIKYGLHIQASYTVVLDTHPTQVFCSWQPPLKNTAAQYQNLEGTR